MTVSQRESIEKAISELTHLPEFNDFKYEYAVSGNRDDYGCTRSSPENRDIRSWSSLIPEESCAAFECNQ